jgi:P-type Ca2+ transporter type 2C
LTVTTRSRHAVLDENRPRTQTSIVETSSLSEMYQRLNSSPRGLSQAEATRRLSQYGRNVLQKVQQKPLILKFLANFTHLMALLLWAGGIVALVAQLPQLAIAIWLVNLINGSFSFWQEFKAEKASEALRQLLPSYAKVLRDGKESQTLAEELVPGDVILLTEGDHISADARLIRSSELQLDQSMLTGESRPVRKEAEATVDSRLNKAEQACFVFAGTNVASGNASALVYATGMKTELGNIAYLTQSLGGELSPLQKEIEVVTRVVTMIAVGVGIVFFILAATLTQMRLGESFIFALGMIVAFVPEGLLPTVTLALAMGVQRMAKRQALVKRLSAVETLGSTSVICTDKTGTLTKNEMTVRALWVAGQNYEVGGIGYTPDGSFSLNARAVQVKDLQPCLRAAALCNNARLVEPNENEKSWHILGDPTEAALLVAARKAELKLEQEQKNYPRWRELPFDARRKRMSTIHRVGNDYIAFVKGAPKEVLSLCKNIDNNGVQELSHELRKTIMAVNDDYARAGLRVLAVATRQLPNDLQTFTPETVERDLTFLGLVAMMDPPRPEVLSAVTKCKNAGIRVIMITGDYGLTAESIARRVGIMQTQARILSGGELDALSDEALKGVLEGEVIIARASPEHKLRIAKLLQEIGHVVAMTGDGVNDAPALKQADIGVAMGRSGTDVAKEAADMILLDDNFASIVNAIEEGRAVYANIKRFTSYIFTSNTPEAVPFILFAFSGGRIPPALNVMQILSVDLGTDLVPALALGAEPPEPGVMNKPPRKPSEHVITRSLLARAYLWLGFWQSLAAMVAFYFFYWTNGYAGQWLDLPSSGPLYQAATAMTLAAIVTTQIGNLFAHRTESISIFRRGLGGNRLVWIGIISELVVVSLIIYVPFLQDIFGTAAFASHNWLLLLAFIPLLLLADEVRKFFVRKRQGG